jgi:hypothetical protein
MFGYRSGDAHDHREGVDKCLICSSHDLAAHVEDRRMNREPTCPKCKKNLEVIKSSAKPVVSEEKLEIAKEAAERLLGEHDE